MRRYAVLAACILFFAASQAWAEFYRWVDKDGKEFFTNELLQVPQEYRGSATKVQTDASRVSVGEKPVAAGRTTAAVQEHKDKYGRGEAYWRKRADKPRNELRKYQDEYDLIVKHEKDEDGKPLKLTSKKKKAISSREKKKAQLEKKIEHARKVLEVDLPEEARRADAYPGWVRE
jgi:vacuolar-type H+-ATPase subunit I/STV1